MDTVISLDLESYRQSSKFHPLTAILAGLVPATNVFFQKVLVAPQGQPSVLVSVASTLVIVAAFTPIKNHLQVIVDKYFKEHPNPAKRLAAFCDQIKNRLFPLDPGDVTRRLLEEAVLAFEAESGAVYWSERRRNGPTHATRRWNGDAQMTAPLEAGPGGLLFGEIALGPRRTGQEYTSSDQRVIQEASHVVVNAILQDRNTCQADFRQFSEEKLNDDILISP